MDKRSSRNKKSKHRSSRTHERPNQGILGRVASKVKGILSPWFTSVWNSADDPSCSSEDETTQEHSPQAILQSNKRPRLSLLEHSSPSCSSNVSHTAPSLESNFTSQSSRGIKRLRLHEHSIPGCSTSIFNENSGEQDYSISNSSFDSKRRKLRLPDHNPVLSPGTQAWLEAPDRPNIFSQSSLHVSASNAQNSLLENKDSSVILNGDDHSENSEGSASTSGCSSLVSHKDRTSCISSILAESDIKIRRDAAKQKELSGDISSNRLSLWSTRASPSIYRSPSAAMQSTQPGFCLSAFSSPKLSQQADKKVSSPFYQGRTTFGGASASRRMPIAAAPYQVSKPLRNQLKIRSNEAKDDYESMSSAAKRILQTLEKMSSPVTDAKKIPNTNKSPVDLSVYLMPPKHRRNLQSTPTGPSKGPPIADISTISKLTTIKSYNQRKFQNTSLDSSTLIGDSVNNTINSLLPEIVKSSSPSPSLPSGGGKMKTKLNQQHKPSVKCKFGTNVSEMESRMSEYIDLISETNLPEMPLPIVSLPTIKFGNSTPKTSNELNQSGKDFVFSNPIEHVMPNSSLTSHTSSSNNNKLIKNSSVFETTFVNPPSETPAAKLVNSFIQSTNGVDKYGNDFTFSNPIEHAVPNALLSSPAPLSVNVPLEKSKSTFTFGSNSTTPNLLCSTNKEISKAGMKQTQDVKSSSVNSVFGKISEKLEKKPDSNVSLTNTASSSSAPLSQFISKVPKWECDVCMIRNDMNKLNCAACEAPKPKKYSETSETSTTSSTSTPTSGFTFGSQSSSKPVSTSEASKSVPTFGSKPLSNNEVKSPSSISGFGTKLEVNTTTIPSLWSFKPSKPVWECDVCLVRNDMDKQKCVACESIRPNEKLTAPKIVVSSVSQNLASNSAISTTASGFQFGTQSTAVSISSTGTESTKPVMFGSKILTADPVPFSTTESSTVRKADSVKSSAQSAFSKPSDNTSDLLSSKTATSNIPIFQFSSKVSSDLWECLACSTKNEKDRDKCKTCDVDRSQKSSSDDSATAAEVPSLITNTPSFDSTIQSPINVKSAENTKTNFVFGVKNNSPNPLLGSVANKPKTENTPTSDSFKSPSVLSAFSKPATSSGLTSSATSSSSTAPVFQFGVTASPNTSSCWECSSCKIKNEADKQKCSSCNTERQKKDSTVASVPTTSSIAFQFGNTTTTNTAPASSPAAAKFSFGVKQESSNPLLKSNTQSTENTLTPGLFGNNSVSATFGGSNKQSSAGFTFGTGSVASSTTPAAVFQFGAKASTDTSTGCASCQGKSEDDKLKCVTCHPEKNISAVSTSKPLSITGFPVNTATTSAASVFKFGNQAPSTTSSSTFGTTNPTFSFGVKPEATKQLVPSSQASLTPFGSTPTQSVFGSSTNTPSFGKPNETPGGFNFASSTPANTVAPVFQFGVRSSSDALSWECTKCGMKNESAKEQCSSCQNERPGKKVSGFTFKANNEVKPSVPAASFNAPAPATTASGFTFNTAAPTSSGGFVFGVKNEPVTSTPAALFSFGSAAPKPSFEPSPAPATPFHFQAAVGTGAPASTFGTPSNNFTFTPKTENINALQPATVTQTPSFGNTPAQPMFGNAAATPAFGKQAPSGFNFTLAAASNPSPAPVFQFGAVEKKQSTPNTGGFQFGTPTQEASTFQPPQFNLSTPPAFNFGAGPGSQAGPFQFAASTDSPQASSAAPQRRIRKAVRRMK